MSLPQSVVDLIELLGYEATMRLVDAFGGLKIEVPYGRVEGPLTARIIQTLGGGLAARFMATYGGEELYIPRCVQAIRDERDRAIQADYDAGSRVPDIAQKYMISERWVWVVLKRAIGDQQAGRKRDDSQLDMFNTTNG
ncbi:MAG: Mor transcription activator family protein [Pseudomonadota bacterium]